MACGGGVLGITKPLLLDVFITFHIHLVHTNYTKKLRVC